MSENQREQVCTPAGSCCGETDLSPLCAKPAGDGRPARALGWVVVPGCAAMRLWYNVGYSVPFNAVISATSATPATLGTGVGFACGARNNGPMPKGGPLLQRLTHNPAMSVCRISVNRHMSAASDSQTNGQRVAGSRLHRRQTRAMAGWHTTSLRIDGGRPGAVDPISLRERVAGVWVLP